MVTHDLTRPGLLIVGDAAGFTLNTGLTIRGMDLAAGSAIAAATAANKALDAADFSLASMDAYRADLATTFVGADMKTYDRAPAFLENPLMYGEVGLLLSDVLYGVFNHDLTPRKHLLGTAMKALKKSPMTIIQMAKLAVAAVRAL